MKGAIRLGSYANIPVKLHWSFGILFILVFALGKFGNVEWIEILLLELFVVVLFFCVILHEFGHALMAKSFGIKTRDIILSPIGGIARLEYLPKQPKKEILIAFAGPMVNLIIAATGFIFLLIFNYDIYWTFSMNLDRLQDPGIFFQQIVLINMYLFFFNLVPAFPMDGGRILRALIAFKTNRLLATQIASGIGIFLSMIFIVYGFYQSNFVLVFIGGFVSLMASSENRSVKYEYFMDHITLKDVATSYYPKLYLQDTIQSASEAFKSSGFDSLPVFDLEESMIGMVYKGYFKDQVNVDNKLPIRQFMMRSYRLLDENIPLKDLTELMNTENLLLIAFNDEDGKMNVIDRKRLQAKLDAVDKDA